MNNGPVNVDTECTCSVFPSTEYSSVLSRASILVNDMFPCSKTGSENEALAVDAMMSAGGHGPRCLLPRNYRNRKKCNRSLLDHQATITLRPEGYLSYDASCSASQYETLREHKSCSTKTTCCIKSRISTCDQRPTRVQVTAIHSRSQA
jgi:hypothetical protein